MKLSTWLYALSAALFITAFTIDVEEMKKRQEKAWRDADESTELGTPGDVGSNANGRVLSDKRSAK
jgi:hypothetical protein